MQKIFVLTKTPNDLQRHESTLNDLQWGRNNQKHRATSKKLPEMTCNDLRRVITSLKRPTTTYNQQRNNLKQPTASSVWHYFTIWDIPFSSFTIFPPNIWLQSFEHCFTENHDENRAPNIYMLSSWLLRDIKFDLQHPLWTTWKTVNWYLSGKS